MKRKDYQKPTMKVVQLQHRTHLLQASGQKSGKMNNPDDYELQDDPFNF
jgi:hypothetical protein